MATNSSSQCDKFELSFPVQITQRVYLSVIFLLSLVGNTLLIIVVYKRPELRKTLNYFIVNMAVSDFAFPLIAIPASFLGNVVGSWEWPIGGTAGLILCKIRNFFMAISLTVSMESLVWIAIERFVAVVWPMKVRSISSRFCAFAIASTWIVSVVFNSPDLYFSEVFMKNGTITCTAGMMSAAFLTYGYTRVAVSYIAPLVLITILYSAIAVTLRRQDKVLQGSTTQRNDRKKRQAIKMSVCIMALFYLFVFPFAITLTLWLALVSHLCSFPNHFYLFSSSALYISSTTNPIICFTFVESFRRGLKDVLNLSLRKRFKTSTVETRRKNEIVLRSIRVISSGMEKNMAFDET